ncbi:hypothetical protein N7453_002348, partial [Penicillium expansum]
EVATNEPIKTLTDELLELLTQIKHVWGEILEDGWLTMMMAGTILTLAYPHDCSGGERLCKLEQRIWHLLQKMRILLS